MWTNIYIYLRHYIWDEWIQLGHVYHNENIGGKGHGKKIIQLYFQALSSPLFLSCSSFIYLFIIIIIIINKLTQDTKTRIFERHSNYNMVHLFFIFGERIWHTLFLFFFGWKIWYTLKKALLSLINILLGGFVILWRTKILHIPRSCQYQ